MLYRINNKCYVKIAPSIYVEVNISEDGKITPTKNKIEINSNTNVETTTLQTEIKRVTQNKMNNTNIEKNIVNKKNNNKRKK